MFTFEEWHSALEMKLYLHRFILRSGPPGLLDAEVRKYNQFESLVLPLVTWLTDQGVNFSTAVVADVDFMIEQDEVRKQASASASWRRASRSRSTSPRTTCCS